LRPLFGAAVVEPIRLHVDAKRFLCAREPGYRAALSPDPKRSLQLQGGVFSAAEAEAFEALSHAGAAVKLRGWDDSAKRADAAVPELAHFVRYREISAAAHRRAVAA